MDSLKEENKKLRLEKSELLERMNKITKGKPTIGGLTGVDNKKLQDYDNVKSKTDFWNSEIKKIMEVARVYIEDIPGKILTSETIAIENLSDVTTCIKTLINRISVSFKYDTYMYMNDYSLNVKLSPLLSWIIRIM
jgi:hypothetical protein